MEGKFIVLLGPDGCGKSTIAEDLKSSIRKRGYAIHHFHWRPNLIPQLRKRRKAHEADTAPPAPTEFAYGYTVSFVRFLYYYLDFFFGYWFRVYRLKHSRTIVIGERWYLDILIHPARYGFKLPISLIRIFGSFLPTPDRTFLLSADPQMIHDRKPELTVEQIEAQLSAMKDLVYGTKNGHIIDTGTSIDESISEILRLCDLQDSNE